MASYIWVNIGPGNRLLPDGTKPLHIPCWFLINKTLNYLSEWNSIAYMQVMSHKIQLKITFLEWWTFSPGHNEFIICFQFSFSNPVLYSISNDICTQFCCALFWLYLSSQLTQFVYLPIFFSVVSLALGQSYDCPSASEWSLKNMGEIDQNPTLTK